MKTAKELRAQRAALHEKAQGILDTAEKANRDFTPEEQEQWDTIQAEMTALGKRADRLEQEEAEHRATLPINRIGDDASGDGVRFRDLQTGREVRGYRHGERMADDVPGTTEDWRGLSFGKFVVGALLGRWEGAERERHMAETSRAMSVGTDASGGFLVPEPLSMQFIDLARNFTAVGRAGATFVPMSTATLYLARNAGDPSAGWKNENAEGTSSDMTLERLTLTARTLFANIKLSAELVEDSPNIGTVVEQALQQAMAVEMDRVALVGSGVAPEPQGVYLATGVNTYSLDATISNYDFVSQAVQLVREDNHEPNGMIAAPRTYGELDRLKDTQNQPLAAPRSFSDLRHFSTSQIPVDLDVGGSPANQTIAIVGDWREMLIGTRMQVSVEASRQAADPNNSDSAWTRYQVWIRAIARMDVQLMRPKGFCVVDEIFAS